MMRNILHFHVKSHIYFQFRHIFLAHVFVLFLFQANTNNADTLVLRVGSEVHPILPRSASFQICGLTTDFLKSKLLEAS